MTLEATEAPVEAPFVHPLFEQRRGVWFWKGSSLALQGWELRFWGLVPDPAHERESA